MLATGYQEESKEKVIVAAVVVAIASQEKARADNSVRAFFIYL